MAVHGTHLICVIHVFPCTFSFVIAVYVRIIFHETFHIERNYFPLSLCEKVNIWTQEGSKLEVNS